MQRGNILIVFAVLLSIGVGAALKLFPQLIKSSSLSRKRVSASLDVQNALEYSRSEAITVVRQFGLSGGQLRASLREGFGGSASANTWQNLFTTEHAPGGAPAGVSIRAKSVTQEVPLPASHSFEQEITIRDPGTKSVLKVASARLNLGVNAVFNNAVTGNRLTCVFCHAHIYGNVGEYWDHEQGPGHGSVNDRIHGTWYSAGRYIYTAGADSPMLTVPSGINLPTSDQRVLPDLFTPSIPYIGNPSRAQISREFLPNYQGPQLPWNSQRAKQMLPKFDPNSALIVARGTLSGGTIHTVPYAPPTPPTPQIRRTPIVGIFDGNAILDGRTAPLRIDGRVFFRGDVIILGTVTGKGAVMSGRNIYVAGDLRYLNSPMLGGGQRIFDGSQASNQVLDTVSENAPALAAQLRGDQLALFATNNIILGSPYAYPTQAVSGRNALTTVMKFTDVVLLPNYAGQLGTDVATGYMLDAEPLSPTTMAFLFPWSKADQFLPPDRVIKSQHRAYSGPASAPNDTEYFLDALGYAAQPYLADLFYPKNTNGLRLVDWITSANFDLFTRDAAYVAGVSAVDPLGRRGQFRWFPVPLFKESPYDATKWKTGLEAASGGFTEGALNTLERYTGFMGEIAGKTDQSGTPLSTVLQQAFDQCKGLLTPVTAGRTRFSSDFPLGMGTGFGGPPTPNEVWCEFMYWAGTRRTSIIAAPTVVPFTPFANWDADLQIRFNFNFRAEDPGYQATVRGYFWNPAKVPVRNRVSQVDAFLFANHFLVPGNDYYVDNALAIHGGIVAKDILGNFANIPGNQRPLTPKVQMDDNPDIAGPVSYGPASIFHYLPGVTIKLDPRAQFDLELLYEDFGAVESIN